MELADSFASFAYQGMRHSPWLTSRERWGMSHSPSSLSHFLWGMTLDIEGIRPGVLSKPHQGPKSAYPGEA